MPRVYAAYIVVVVFDDQHKSYHGPFFTEDRAKAYIENAYGVVDYSIEPLVIPHRILLEMVER